MSPLNPVRIVITLGVSACLFLTHSTAWAYGGYHHYYGGHVSYYHHDHGDTAGYVILGILGGLLLAHIFDRDDDYRYPRRTTTPVIYNPPPQAPVTAPVRTPVKQYFYAANEGWDKLISGDAGHALDIFAVQSQQDLDSGQPRIGFALAAAAIGETDRGIRAMRKALDIDPQALMHLQTVSGISPTVDYLDEVYKEELSFDASNNDIAFMVASLSYLQQDYITARNVLSATDLSPSANNLRQLVRQSLN